jgi:hypothetical protein
MILPNTETMFHAFASLADVYASVTTPFRLVCMIWFGSIVAAIVIFFVNLEVKKHPNRRTKDDVKQERQEHIRRSVNTKKLCDLSVIRTTTTKTTTRKALNDTESDSIAESLEDTSCAICLGDYQKGEIVCWSRNAKCNHVFHLECAEEWLMRNVECPCCRFKFIFNNNNNTNGDNTFLTFLRGCTCFILAQLFSDRSGVGGNRIILIFTTICKQPLRRQGYRMAITTVLFNFLNYTTSDCCR